MFGFILCILAGDDLLGILLSPDIDVVLSLQAIDNCDQSTIAFDLLDVLVTLRGDFLGDERSELYLD